MKLKKIYSKTIHEVEKNIFQNYFRNRMTEKYIPKLFGK
jgi:DNA-directed RNA polymerase specialized sigma subunit